MKTFRNWPLTFLSPGQLARNGFYYLGTGDEVKCAFCNIEIMKWKVGDDPAKDHALWSAYCPFVRRERVGNDVTKMLRSKNIPLPTPTKPATSDDKSDNSDNLNFSDLDLRRVEERLKTFKEWPITFLSPERLASNGFYYLGRGDEVRCAFCKVEIMRWEEGDDPAKDHKRWAPQCPFLRKQTSSGTNSIDSTQETYEHFSHIHLLREEVRLQTYRKWPHTFLTPEILASNCFYFVGRFDTVRCVRCNIEFSGWKKGDDPASEHRRTSPNCPFVKSQTVPCSENERGNSNNFMAKPSHPMYASVHARLNSFENWPTNARQKTDDLAEAGFFYTGVDDKTKCFFCNGGFYDWENNDDPWEHHAQWFSKCPYVELVKGSEYIKKIQAKTGNKAESKEESESQEETVPETSNAKEGLDKTQEKTSEKDSKLCQICYDEERNVAFVPCGHVVACAKCALSITKCPMCRKEFATVLRLYYS